MPVYLKMVRHDKKADSTVYLKNVQRYNFFVGNARCTTFKTIGLQSRMDFVANRVAVKIW